MTAKPITRRRFLTVCAAAGVYASMPLAHAFATAPLHRWNGILLGAQVSLTLAHPSKKTAYKIFETCVNEIKRLEDIFTLYDSHSELARLNKSGLLKNPSADLINILQLAKHYNEITDGAFDISVKALEDGKTSELVGMEKIHVNKHEIRLETPEMALTLNGIAQGYITDRVTELLKAEGLKNVLVELGEKRTIGTHPSGRPWTLALPDHEDIALLNDMALATSSSFSADNGKPHIIDPSNGRYITTAKTISVVATTATMADALSTAFLSMRSEDMARLQETQPNILKIYS